MRLLRSESHIYHKHPPADERYHGNVFGLMMNNEKYLSELQRNSGVLVTDLITVK
jgi:hypothetical protein